MIRKEKVILVFCIILASLAGLVSCKKEKFLTNGGELRFSTDTLHFDTVFTTMGSATRSFKIYNENNQRIKLENIKLSLGNNSPFRLNVDGEAVQSIDNVELAPFDSIYVFVAVTIDPTSGTTPFLVNEKVEITLNGKRHEVPLEAYGQDAHYIVGKRITTETWTNDKPYVIINSAYVDSEQVLTIQKGCRIYMHQNSTLYIKGTLRAFGTKTDSIIFQGDRLDRDYFGYRDFPGEWAGIRFVGKANACIMNYCVIKNAGAEVAAVFVQPPEYFIGDNNMLEMNYCTISNSASYGLICVNSRVTLNNTLIHTCGLQNVAVLEGGNYNFNFCSIVNFGGLGINHINQPSVVMLNYLDKSLTDYVGNDLNANFNNCVIDGSLEDEMICAKKGSWSYTTKLTNCAIKRKDNFNGLLPILSNCIFNKDNLFKDKAKWDFRIPVNSPLKGAGFSIPTIIDDLDGVSRPNPPSIGCYEAQ